VNNVEEEFTKRQGSRERGSRGKGDFLVALLRWVARE